MKYFISHIVSSSVITYENRPPAPRTVVPHPGHHRHSRVALAATGQQAVASRDRVPVPTGSIAISSQA